MSKLSVLWSSEPNRIHQEFAFETFLYRQPFLMTGEASKVEALPQTPPKARLWNPILN
jgi:hypothetical protein